MENSEPKYKVGKGSIHIAFFALRTIKVGEEILFNYGENYQLDWLLEFNEAQRKKRREQEALKRKNKKKAAKIDLFEKSKVLEEDLIFSDLEGS